MPKGMELDRGPLSERISWKFMYKKNRINRLKICLPIECSPLFSIKDWTVKEATKVIKDIAFHFINIHFVLVMRFRGERSKGMLNKLKGKKFHLSLGLNCTYL